MVSLTVLTPLDLGRRPRSFIKRVTALSTVLEKIGAQLVVGHVDRGCGFDARLRHVFGEQDHVRIVSDPASNTAPNLSRLRNNAAARADGEILLLLDADISPDPDLFLSLAEQVEAGASVAMAPCIYLSREGTAKIRAGVDKASIIVSALDFSPDLVLHWAIPSSVMALRRSDYHALGGFDESYEGHGYEDHDFMLRLALAKGLIEPRPDILVDHPYRAPLLSEGFRSALGQLCLANLLDGNIAFHLFHDRDNVDPYYQRRTDNAALFQSRFSDLKNASALNGSVPPLIAAFFEECRERDLDPAKFHALFDARPRYRLKRRPLYQRMWRKVRRSV